MNEKTSEKIFFSKKTRVVALILSVLLIGEIIFSSSVAVSFSSKKFADSEFEQAAAYIEQNDNYLSAGTLSRMRSAVSLLKEPKTYEQLSLFASVAIADEEYGKAAGYLLRAAEQFPGEENELAPDYVKIGCLYALDRNWNEAAAHFKKAIALDASDPSSRLMLCETYLNLDDYENALSALKEYAALADLSAKELDALIRLQIELEKYDEAFASCANAEEDGSLAPADAALYRAEIYYRKGDYQNALEQAELSRNEGGDLAGAASIAAAASEETGDYKKALETCLLLIESGEADLPVYQQAAQDAYLISDFENVLRVSEEALEKFPGSDEAPSFRKWLGLAYFESNKLDKAEENFSAVLEGGEAMPELNYLRAVCEMAGENYEAAADDFTAALALEELTDEALYNRALCYLQLGNTDAASVDFQEIINRGRDAEIVAQICELLQITPDQLEQTNPAE